MTEEEEIAILKDQIDVLTEQIEKMKCCGICKYWKYSALIEDYICKRTDEIRTSQECYTEKMDKCDKWEISE